MADEKSNHTALKVFAVILIIVLIAGFAARNRIKSFVKEKAAAVIVEKLLDEKITSDAKISGRLSAKEFYESMDEQDRQKVMDIITSNMTDENIRQVKSHITNGDMSGLKQYVKENLSGEDKAAVQKIYEKYKYKLKQ